MCVGIYICLYIGLYIRLFSRVQLFVTPWTEPTRLGFPGSSAGKESDLGSISWLGSSPGEREDPLEKR